MGERGLPDGLDEEGGENNQAKSPQNPASLAGVEEHEGEKGQGDQSVGCLGVEHQQGEGSGAERIEQVLMATGLLGLKIHDEKQAESCPSDPVVEHRKRQ